MLLEAASQRTGTELVIDGDGGANGDIEAERDAKEHTNEENPGMEPNSGYEAEGARSADPSTEAQHREQD